MMQRQEQLHELALQSLQWLGDWSPAADDERADNLSPDDKSNDRLVVYDVTVICLYQRSILASWTNLLASQLLYQR